MQAESGTLWRIRRVAGEPAGQVPPTPAEVPLYLGQYLAWLALLVGAAAGSALAIRSLVRRLRR